MEHDKGIKIIIAKLQSHLSNSGLSAASLNDTRKRLNRLMRYCEERNISSYTEGVGQQYLEHECVLLPTNSSGIRKYRVLIDRLNCALNQVQWVPYIRKPKKRSLSCYDSLINEYISYLRRAGKTDSNIKDHKRDVYQFLMYIERQGCTEIGELTVNLIESAFVAATGKKLFSYFVGTFLKWLCLQEIITTDFRAALPKPIRHYGVPSVYSPIEVETILSSFNRSTEVGKRDYAMTLVAARLGLRASDISGLQFENLREHGIDVFVPEFIGESSSYVPYVFSESEINSLFRVIDDGLHNTTELTKIQFPLFVRLLYGCGLRLSEALNLRISDIDFEQGVIFIKSAKGNRDRILPVHETLKIILQQYCINFLKMSFSNNSLLFVGRLGQNCYPSKPRSVSWAEVVFQKALRAANIELFNDPNSSRDICLYCLRHTFAVNSFRIQERVGVDTYRSTPFLSLYMGHKNLMGTETYLHMTDANAEDVLTLTAMHTENLFPGVPNEK